MASYQIYSDASSPDPLNDSTSDPKSFIASSPSKQRASRKSSLKPEISSSHGRTLSSSSQCSYQPHSSPSKTVTEQTLSPWKIRVTVEAEPEDAEMASRMQTVTRTTTIPLRGDSSPTPVQQTTPATRTRRSSSRSRSRSGSVTTNKGRQRSSTPQAGRRRRQSVTDLDIVVLGDDAAEDEWEQRPRRNSPRKSRTKSTKEDSRSRGISSVLDEDDQGPSEVGVDGQYGSQTTQSQSPELRQIDLNNVSVRRPRANSTRQKSSTLQAADRPILSKENVDPTGGQDSIEVRKVSVNSTRSYPTPSPTPSESDHAYDEQGEIENVDGFDTVMESEGFTMIDLDSIPSVQQLRSSPLFTVGPNAEAGLIQPAPVEPEEEVTRSQLPSPKKPFPSYLQLAEGESDISSALPSSPPLPTSQLRERQPPQGNVLQLPSSTHQTRHRHVTPHTYSSPKLPSPPRPSPPKEKATPDSSKALKAGITLQNVVEPPRFPSSKSKTAQRVLTPQPAELAQPKELFGGFDSGIQRELRAGLRLGEELARRPISSPINNSPDPAVISQVSHPQVWRVEHSVQRVPLISRLNQKSNSAGLGQSFRTRRSSMLSQMTNASEESTQHSCSNSTKDDQEDCTARDDDRQDLTEPIPAKQANPDAAIIDGREETELEIQDVTMQDDGDIWLAEAIESSSSPRVEVDQPQLSNKSNETQHERQGVASQRRNVNSRLQNRDHGAESDVGDATFATNAEGDTSMSGLFWKAGLDEGDGDIRFGAGQIDDTRRRLRQSGGSMFGNRSGSGTFDLNKMLGTPRRIRESLDQELEQQQQRESEQTDLLTPRSYDNNSSVEESHSGIVSSSVNDQPQKIPVNFNDSSLSQPETPPVKTRRSLSPSAQRPPTPRSALKGTRQSLGSGNERQSVESSEAEERRVVWARRSNHMDEDWIESSRSMISESSSVDDLSEQANRLSCTSTDEVEEDDLPTPTRIEPQHQLQPQSQHQQQQQSAGSKGWFGWFQKENLEKNVASGGRRSTSESEALTDDASNVQVETTDQETAWEPTAKSAISPRSEGTSRSSISSSSKSSRMKLPSYLCPPSYPSDPKRCTTKPLSTSGSFTNTHFRTLHILYAKSSRPRFHAPQIEECRPEIRKLVTEKWSMYIDEERAGMGGFEFKIGEKEGRVLERFCREIEWGYLSRLYETYEISIDDLFADDGDTSGIWGGLGHGMGDVAWGWSCDMLAKWLGRIVVGEVVRSEEFRK